MIEILSFISLGVLVLFGSVLAYIGIWMYRDSGRDREEKVLSLFMIGLGVLMYSMVVILLLSTV